MNEEGIFEFIEPEEIDGVTYHVPSYCNLDLLLFYQEEQPDLIVNCKPIDKVIEGALKKQIDTNIKHR